MIPELVGTHVVIVQRPGEDAKMLPERYDSAEAALGAARFPDHPGATSILVAAVVTAKMILGSREGRAPDGSCPAP